MINATPVFTPPSPDLDRARLALSPESAAPLLAETMPNRTCLGSKALQTSPMCNTAARRWQDD